MKYRKYEEYKNYLMKFILINDIIDMTFKKKLIYLIYNF